jgi:hypothetical protein
MSPFRRPPMGPAHLKKYVAGFPAADVARDQLPVSVAEFSTHENQRVTKALNDGPAGRADRHQDAGPGDEDAQKPKPTASCATTSDRAHRPDTKIAAAARRACLAAAAAGLGPAVRLHPLAHRGTLDHSFHSTPKGGRPAVVGRPGELPGDARRSGVLEGAEQQPVFAGATIPLSIGLALVMALWVNERIAAAPSCAWPTSRPPCCR